MAKIGYGRVSTQQQDLKEQLDALKAFGCQKIFAGKHSGKAKENQEQLDEMLSYVREGDQVVVTKLDRLGRSLSQCLKVLDIFKEKNIGLIALNQSIDTTKRTDPMTTAMIHLLGLFAELERNFIVERTQGGKAVKIAKGDTNAIGGRPKKLSEKSVKSLIKDLYNGISINNAAVKCKM